MGERVGEGRGRLWTLLSSLCNAFIDPSPPHQKKDLPHLFSNLINHRYRVKYDVYQSERFLTTPKHPKLLNS